MIVEVLQEKIDGGWEYKYTFFKKDFVYFYDKYQLNKVVQNLGIEIMSYLMDEHKMTAEKVIPLLDILEFKIYQYPILYKLKDVL